jgi:methyltransferase (TIGR00027 family)
MRRVFPAAQDWPDYHRQWVAVRTRFIDDLITREMGEKGAKNVVVLGAGVDMRAFRLASLAGATVVEVETQEMSDAREALMTGLGVEPMCAKRVDIACDVTDVAALKSHLAGAGVSSSAGSEPTVWVLEGLVMYIPKDAVVALIALIGELSAKGSFLICNFMFSSAAEAAGHLLGREEVVEKVRAAGFSEDVQCHVFGDDVLNMGRYPAGKAPDESFSFVVGRKA